MAARDSGNGAGRRTPNPLASSSFHAWQDGGSTTAAADQARSASHLLGQRTLSSLSSQMQSEADSDDAGMDSDPDEEYDDLMGEEGDLEEGEDSNSNSDDGAESDSVAVAMPMSSDAEHAIAHLASTTSRMALGGQPSLPAPSHLPSNPDPTATAAAASASTAAPTCAALLDPSLFRNCNPAVNFPDHGQKVTPLPKCLQSMLKWRMSNITPNVIKQWLKIAGFQPTKRSTDWLGYWGKHMKAATFRNVLEYQKTNHFPGSFCIGRKDCLWIRLQHMQLKFGRRNFDFFPQTYVLPRDLVNLRQQWDDSGKQKWIIKPPASARGIGIHVINRWSALPRRRNLIVQKYLDKPYLINESKFDLRVYVYVTSYDPLRIYVYEDGLVRFATCKYNRSSKHVNNRFMHLTNYSINKKNTDFTANSDENVCQGHKWGLKALWRHLDEKGIDSESVWASIIDVVIKTIIASESSINSQIKAHVRRRSCVHELFGFDIFLDEALKPYVLEVNISPSLHSNSKLDHNIKGGMLRDLLNMSNFQLPCQPDNAAGAAMKKLGYPSDWTVCPAAGVHLQSDEKSKHACFANGHAVQDIRDLILDDLTPDDLRILMETEDEFGRRGNFLRVFPTMETRHYDQFFDVPRYYNILLNEWIHHYRSTPRLGIKFLQQQAQSGYHLLTSRPVADQWIPPEGATTRTFLTGRLRSSQMPARRNTVSSCVGVTSSPGKKSAPARRNSLSSGSVASVRSAAAATRTAQPSAPAAAAAAKRPVPRARPPQVQNGEGRKSRMSMRPPFGDPASTRRRPSVPATQHARHAPPSRRAAGPQPLEHVASARGPHEPLTAPCPPRTHAQGKLGRHDPSARQDSHDSHDADGDAEGDDVSDVRPLSQTSLDSGVELSQSSLVSAGNADAATAEGRTAAMSRITSFSQACAAALPKGTAAALDTASVAAATTANADATPKRAPAHRSRSLQPLQRGRQQHDRTAAAAHRRAALAAQGGSAVEIRKFELGHDGAPAGSPALRRQSDVIAGPRIHKQHSEGSITLHGTETLASGASAVEVRQLEFAADGSDAGRRHGGARPRTDTDRTLETASAILALYRGRLAPAATRQAPSIPTRMEPSLPSIYKGLPGQKMG